MPKLKTNKSTAKRFKVTSKGKIKRYRAGKRHLLSHMTTKRKRKLRQGGMVKPMEVPRLKKLLGLA